MEGHSTIVESALAVHLRVGISAQLLKTSKSSKIIARLWSQSAWILIAMYFYLSTV